MRSKITVLIILFASVTLTACLRGGEIDIKPVSVGVQEAQNFKKIDGRFALKVSTVGWKSKITLKNYSLCDLQNIGEKFSTSITSSTENVMRKIFADIEVVDFDDIRDYSKISSDYDGIIEIRAINADVSGRAIGAVVIESYDLVTKFKLAYKIYRNGDRITSGESNGHHTEDYKHGYAFGTYGCTIQTDVFGRAHTDGFRSALSVLRDQILLEADAIRTAVAVDA